MEEVFVGEADAVFEFGLIGPSEFGGFAHIEELTWGAVRTGGVPFDFAFKTNNFGYKFGESLDGDLLACAGIHCLIARIVVHEEHAEVGKVIPIIATLGMQYIYRGLTYFISGTQWVSSDKMLAGYKDFALRSFLGINNLFWIVIVVFIGMIVFLKWSGFGRQIYAVGSNADAAKISGINIDRVKIIVYTINGAIAGLAGAMYTSLYASAQGNMATGAEMDVIAACVIGGVSLNGGQGNAVGVLMGALTIAIISKSLSLVGIDAFWQQALKGAIILVAVLINVIVQRNAARRALEGREI